MTKWVAVVLVLVTASLVPNLNGAVTVPVEGPENSIKDVMKTGFKGGLLKKVLGGDATDAEKAELLGLMIDLIENEPEKGELSEWRMTAGPAVLAAGKVVVGREGALEELKATTNCKACHDKFK